MRNPVSARALLPVLALVVVPAFGRCSCEPEEEPPPPPPIGVGDPIERPDAGDVYEVDAGPVVCDEDDNEDNDARADAVALASEVPADGTVCGDDDDWFAIASAPGCTVVAELTIPDGAGATGDADMLMFDPDGQLVGSSNTPGGGEAINAVVNKDGLYAVRLRAGSRDIVPYELVLSSVCAADLVCPADDRLEDNDAPATPAALTEGVGHDGIICGIDEDWFIAPVTIGCVADARLEFIDADGDIDIELFQGDGVTRVARSNGVADNERIARVVTGAGMRYRVHIIGAASENRYRFVVNEICAGAIACPSDDPFEPNDDRAAAVDLFAPLDEAIGVVCGNDDFYDVVPQAGCTLQGRLAFVHAEGDLDLELVNAGDGSVVASSNGTTDIETIDYVAPSAGRVAFRVKGFSNATNVYRLQVSTACP